MKRRLCILALVTATAVSPAAAQETKSALLEGLLQVFRLPAATQESRVLGVPESDIRSIFDAGREQGLPIGTLTGVFEEANTSVREHGPVDNFGAFVQSRLREGLRGRELAAAIRAEHAAHGKGKGHGKGAGDEHGSMRGAEGHGAPGAGGKPEGVGKPESAGKPDVKRGRPETPGAQGTTKGKKGGGR